MYRKNVLNDRWTEYNDNFHKVTLGYYQQICKICMRSIANCASIVKFKTTCKKSYIQGKRTDFSLCSID